RANLFEQREVSRGQQGQILAILLVNPLEVLGNHHLDPRAHLRVWRLLPARSFPTSLAAHRTDESALLYLRPSDRDNASATQPQVRNFPQRLVEIEAVMCWGDLV